eukprot:566882-Pyramimonas_sp.AAC.1
MCEPPRSGATECSHRRRRRSEKPLTQAEDLITLKRVRGESQQLAQKPVLFTEEEGRKGKELNE